MINNIVHNVFLVKSNKISGASISESLLKELFMSHSKCN